MKALRRFLLNEITQEWRTRYALNGALLYVISTVFVCYLSIQVKIQQLDPVSWNALFWIIVLFVSLNTSLRSFMAHTQGLNLYLYTIIKPEWIILGKMMYSSLLLIIISGLAFLFYSILLGNPVQDLPMFLITIVVGSIGLGSSMSLLSAISSKAKNNSSLMAILSFPVVLPILLMLIDLSKKSMDGLAREHGLGTLGVLLALNVIVVTLGIILFPFLWKS